MERRLIDEMALSRLIQSEYHGAISDSEMKVYEVLQRLVAAPTVDAVPVVRCRDCTHYDMGVCLKIYSDGNVCSAAWQTRKPDDFCSYGKRRKPDGEE